MLFKLTNMKTGQATHCGVLEFSAPEGICYIPYWMMSNLCLPEGERIEVRRMTNDVIGQTHIQGERVFCVRVSE